MKAQTNQHQQYEDLGQVDLNQNGRPKQAVILYELTPQMIQDAKQKINNDKNILPQNKYNEAKQKSAKVWDSFYSSHKCNFFKDRNYLEREIKEISYFREKNQQDKQKYMYMELGCGVGNTLFPLLRQYDFFNFQGCDISSQAIKLIQKQMQNHPAYKDRLQVKVCDIVKDQIPFEAKPDLLSMIFVLSAIVPEKHQQVINKIAKFMKPGSCFFFRDYGRYDFGQVNMSNKGNRKLRDNFYVKHDGVCVYYFEQEQVQKMMQNAGLVKVQGSIHCRLLQNRKTGLKMYRIWVQTRYYKPPINLFFLQKFEKQKQQKLKQKQNKIEQLEQKKDADQNKIDKIMKSTNQKQKQKQKQQKGKKQQQQQITKKAENKIQEKQESQKLNNNKQQEKNEKIAQSIKQNRE